MKKLNKIVAMTSMVALAFAAPVAASAANLYGAIAYSQNTGAHGWAKDFDSQRAAERAAMRECKKQANDCRIGVWFMNACGAVAVGQDGGWGSDWGANMTAAENKSMHVCDGYSYNCRVVVAQCISGY